MNLSIAALQCAPFPGGSAAYLVRLRRLADLYEMEDVKKADYVRRENDLLIERDQLEAQPATASMSLQRQRIDSVVDDWSVMTDDERKQVIQMIFSEIRADHAPEGLKVQFMPRAAWAPYVDAVLAKKPPGESDRYHISRPDGVRVQDIGDTSACATDDVL